MSKKQEKIILDLQRLLKTQNFKTVEEAQKFVEQLRSQTIPEFETEALTPEEQAQNLVYQAREEEDIIAADKKIFQAFILDPECVEAFEFLGEEAFTPLQSLIFYKNGFASARRKLGEKFFDKNKGQFWGLHETRPFMRCLLGFGMALYSLDQKEQALNIYLELLTLNPNDNQGVRDQAMLYCLELLKLEKYEALYKQFGDEATAFSSFNRALYLFIKDGDSIVGREVLQKARMINNHVLGLLLSKKELPEMGEHYGIGDKNEAVYYLTFARPVWQSTPNALAWLTAVYQKR